MVMPELGLVMVKLELGLVTKLGTVQAETMMENERERETEREREKQWGTVIEGTAKAALPEVEARKMN